MKRQYSPQPRTRRVQRRCSRGENQEFRPRGLWPSDGGRVAGVIGPFVPVGPDSLLGVPALAGYGAQSIRRNRRSPIESSDGAKIKIFAQRIGVGEVNRLPGAEIRCTKVRSPVHTRRPQWPSDRSASRRLRRSAVRK
jgi:hypothetical protein